MEINDILIKIKSYIVDYNKKILQDPSVSGLQESFKNAISLENELYTSYYEYCSSNKLSLNTNIIKDISFEDILSLKGKNYNLSHVEIAISNHLTKIKDLFDIVKSEDGIAIKNKLVVINKNKKIVNNEHLKLVFNNSDGLPNTDLYHNIQSEIDLTNPNKFERPLTYYILSNNIATFFTTVTEILNEIYKSINNQSPFYVQVYQLIISECMSILYNWVDFFIMKINEEVRVFDGFSKLSEDKQKLINPEGNKNILNESVTNIEEETQSLLECVEEAYSIEY